MCMNKNSSSFCVYGVTVYDICVCMYMIMGTRLYHGACVKTIGNLKYRPGVKSSSPFFFGEGMRRSPFCCPLPWATLAGLRASKASLGSTTCHLPWEFLDYRSTILCPTLMYPSVYVCTCVHYMGNSFF